MPIAAFAGSRGWGYDGVALYAPSPGTERPTNCADSSMKPTALARVYWMWCTTTLARRETI